jgi:hypothetical protein
MITRSMGVLVLLILLGLGMTLTSAMRQTPGLKSWSAQKPPLVFSHKILARLLTGLLVVSLHQLHVYSSTGSHAEVQSELGVVTE